MFKPLCHPVPLAFLPQNSVADAKTGFGAECWNMSIWPDNFSVNSQSQMQQFHVSFFSNFTSANAIISEVYTHEAKFKFQTQFLDEV